MLMWERIEITSYGGGDEDQEVEEETPEVILEEG